MWFVLDAGEVLPKTKVVDTKLQRAFSSFSIRKNMRLLENTRGREPICALERRIGVLQRLDSRAANNHALDTLALT